MKRKLQKIVLLLVCIIPFVPMRSQVLTYSGLGCKNTITRRWSGGQIAYVQETDTSGRFIYVGSMSGFPRTEKLTGYIVTDFAFIGDTIYVTGNKPNGVGFYGWAKMTTPLTLPWVFNMRTFGATVPIYRFSDMRRIKVFRTGEDLHALMIGRYSNLFNNNDKYYCFIDVKNNSTCTYAHCLGEQFDDVEILSNYVATVSRKGEIGVSPASHYMRLLNKNAFSLNDPKFDTMYEWSNMDARERIFLQGVGGNNLVSVYVGRNYEYCINPYRIVGGQLQIDRYYKTSVYVLPYVYGVAYESGCNSLKILKIYDTAERITQIGCAGYPALTFTSSTLPLNGQGVPWTGVKWQSVSDYNTGTFCLTGRYNNTTVIWETGMCASNFTEGINMVEGGTGPTLTPLTRSSMAMQNVVSVSCEREQKSVGSECYESPFDPPVIDGEDNGEENEGE